MRLLDGFIYRKKSSTHKKYWFDNIGSIRNFYDVVKSQNESTKNRSTENNLESILKISLTKGEITPLPGIVDIQK